MKALAEIWDFVTGGSIVAPVAVAVAIGFALLPLAIDAAVRTAAFLAIVAAGFVASTFERPQ
ncbi:MAG: hypothetical protein ACYDGM_12460 [Vulcanimicrobiaceae bacterium]